MLLALRSLWEQVAAPLSVGGGLVYNVKPFAWTPIRSRRPWRIPPFEESLLNTSSGLVLLADAEEHSPALD